MKKFKGGGNESRGSTGDDILCKGEDESQREGQVSNRERTNERTKERRS